MGQYNKVKESNVELARRGIKMQFESRSLEDFLEHMAVLLASKEQEILRLYSYMHPKSDTED